MRFLPTRLHGLIDYLWGAALIATPFLLGVAAGAPLWIAIVYGAGAILYSLATDYERGLVQLIPMPVHLAADGVAGVALAVSPWLFGLSGPVVWIFVAFGLFSLVASLITRDAPAR